MKPKPDHTVDTKLGVRARAMTPNPLRPMLTRMKRTHVLWSGAVAVLLAVSGCTPPAQPAAPSASASPTEALAATPTPVAEVLAADVLLVVSTVATADNGAVLDLTMTVHRPTAFDDAASSASAALMTDACGGGTDDSLYAADLWTFASVDVEAVARPGPSWPANRRITLYPLSTNLNLAADAAVLDDDEVDPATPFCRRDKHLDTAGTGTLVVGLIGDTDDVSAAGQFTRWANQMWGFSAVRVAGQSAADAGIALSDCTFTVTEAGTELNGASAAWIERNDETVCQVGDPTL